MTTARVLFIGLLAILANTAAANLITNGNFDSALNTSTTTITASTGTGDWLALSGHWTIDSGSASNSTPYATNPDYNYILMQGVDLSGFTSSFDSVLSFQYAYEGGFGGLDGRGVRVYGLESTDSVSIFFTSTTFDQLTLLYSKILDPTGNPTTSFAGFTSPAFTIDPSLYSVVVVAFTFGGSPSNDYLRAVDNVDLSGPKPVPEPGSLVLLATGLLALGIKRCRRPN